MLNTERASRTGSLQIRCGRVGRYRECPYRSVEDTDIAIPVHDREPGHGISLSLRYHVRVAIGVPRPVINGEGHQSLVLADM